MLMQFTDQALVPFGRNLLSIEIATDLGLKTPLMFRCARLLVDNGCVSPDTRQLAEMCFDEALANAMVHGNKLDPGKKIRLRLFCDDQRWGAIIEDEGEGFTADKVPTAGSEEFRSVRGRGILLIDSYVDELLYCGEGNRLLMVRHRDKAGRGAPATGAKEAPKPEAGSATGVVSSIEDEGLTLSFAESDQEEAGGIIKVVQEDNVAVVEIMAPRLSDANVDELRKAVEKVVASNRTILVDMVRVTYVSSVILGAFVSWYRRTKSSGGALKVCRVQPMVLVILKAARFDQVLDPQPDREIAIARMRRKP
jgi:serine/threonine-protein kinase RsbW